mmetsp:Transcript_26452/g.50232  ORF Transcript_26452/g.50232 Transcript_26452/m.50232 type:complete len:420 (-) Transcript_26452:175-1434(-)|eukprot:CAMPEP_0114238372 /NCGR_PEP_ID=MMETSP0058-20121206/7891_1 /TAXON_ID=36894 /ORGANISM="Pyramimonas parkeae, CCMP726" /LENGTH=419 /DNA_ID=CAMNT_0001350481 /DNA_START=116 /DNA_END=1375 /DNA_ORIENTATION=+
MAKGKHPEGKGKVGKVKLADKRAEQLTVTMQLAGGLAVAVVVLGVITAYFQDGDPVVSLSVEQPDLLREAVAGGAPWLLHCTTNATLPSAFLLTTNTAKLLRNSKSDVKVGSVDCNEPLPSSGKSIYEKYFRGVKAKARPEFLLSANGEPPKAVSQAALRDAVTLSKHLQARTKPVIRRIIDSKGLEAQCFKIGNRPCLILLWDGEAAVEAAYPWLSKLAAKQRTTPVGVVNVTKYVASFQQSMPSLESTGGHPSAILLQRSGKGADLAYSGRVLRDTPFDFAGLDDFIQRSQSGEIELLPLSKKPEVKSIRTQAGRTQGQTFPSRDDRPSSRSAKKPSNQHSENTGTTKSNTASTKQQGVKDPNWEQQKRDEMERMEREDAIVREADDEEERGWEEYNEEDESDSYDEYDEDEVVVLD